MRRHTLFVLALAIATVVGFASTASAGPSSDQEIADDSVLTIDDVPDGFEEDDAGDDSTLDAPACAAIRKAAEAINDAPNTEVSFSAGSGDVISLIDNQVTLLASAKRAQVLYRPYAASRARVCLNEGFAESFAARASDDAEVEADFERFDPDGGDAAVGYEGTVVVSTDDGSVEYFIELYQIRIDRGLVSMLFLNTNSPPPSDDVELMIETVLTRLEDSL